MNTLINVDKFFLHPKEIMPLEFQMETVVGTFPTLSHPIRY
jgi:hypothetical protein